MHTAVRLLPAVERVSVLSFTHGVWCLGPDCKTKSGWLYVSFLFERQLYM